MTEAKDTPADNMRLWSVLGRTNPNETKGFKRAGGFSGTAIKPMWVWQRLTEMFGPMGTGWGCDKPEFQVLPGAGQEVLVYCTVVGWYTLDGGKACVIGVGGDKVIATYSKGPSSDDEAFKKAYTDALMNAFKFIGVGADVHMGRFDDTKYVQELQEEFNAPATITDTQQAELLALVAEVGADLNGFLKFGNVASVSDILAVDFESAKAVLEKKRAKTKPHASDVLEDEIPY